MGHSFEACELVPISSISTFLGCESHMYYPPYQSIFLGNEIDKGLRAFYDGIDDYIDDDHGDDGYGDDDDIDNDVDDYGFFAKVCSPGCNCRDMGHQHSECQLDKIINYYRHQ